MVNVLKPMRASKIKNLGASAPKQFILWQYYLFFLFVLLFFPKLTFAETFLLPEQGNLIGRFEYVRPEVNDNLINLGYRYDLGFQEIKRANPKINSTTLLPLNSTIFLPKQYLLPNTQKEGIVINLAEYRLYYYRPNDNTVITMPVGIGKKGWNTPLGLTKIISKERNPIWRPSQKLQNAGRRKGQIIPVEFPANDANPLGKYALRLGFPTYLIHGSNQYGGVGRRASAGCIRLLPLDAEYLYQLVAVGTKVLIIDEPLKIGFDKGAIYVQVHPKLNKSKAYSPILINKIRKMQGIDEALLQKELENPSGIVRKISR